MPTVNKVFVFTEGELALVRDSFGNQVTFESRKDLERCSGLNFSGKNNINYEPDIETFIDSEDPSIGSDDIPFQPYEQLISNVGLLAQRKRNPLYGLSGTELQEKQAELAAIAAWEARRDEFIAANEAEGTKRITLDQAMQYLDGKYDTTDLDAALTTLNAADTAAEIKAALIPTFVEFRKMLARSKEVDGRIIKAVLELIAEV